jgi:ABC-2 type transport system ATP-binding protein
MSILVEEFHKNYGETVAVAGISFEVKAGTVLGLVGPNGAGKTTTMRALAGIIAPTLGNLAIDGHDLAEEPIAAKAALAYVPDDPKLFDQLTIWEHLQFMGAAYRVQGWQALGEELITQFELTEKRDSPCSDLSRGMRQKVAICCAYLHRPKAIMFDEPLTGLDPYGIRAIKDSIRKRAAEGAAIMISSHLLSLVEDLCTAILVLNKGRQVLHATMDELRQQADADGRHETLEELFFRLTAAPAVASEVPNPEV